jgi:hypothetical protein
VGKQNVAATGDRLPPHTSYARDRRTRLARDVTSIGELERRAEEVVGLPRPRRQAFVAACAERLWPSYPAFSEMEEWGDPAAVRQVLDELWASAEGEGMPAERIGELLASWIRSALISTTSPARCSRLPP